MEENEPLPTTPDVTNERHFMGFQKEDDSKDNVYWKFLDDLEGSMKSFLVEARIGNLNKSAAARARKLSVLLRQNLKDFRELSVAHDKTHFRKTKQEVKLSKELEGIE